MTISDRLKEAKHGPVRQRHEEMKAMHSLNMATGFDLMADLIDSLFEKHAKLIEEAHSRITAAYNSLEGRIDKVCDHCGKLDALQTNLEKAYQEEFEAISNRIDDLADRLSVVHVQAQGDAKVRERLREQFKHAKDKPIVERVVSADEWQQMLAEAVHEDRKGAQQQEDERTSVIDDCLKQGEKRIRLDELGIIAKRLDGKTMPWIAQRLGYQPIPVGETLMNEIEKRRREIEEGT